MLSQPATSHAQEHEISAPVDYRDVPQVLIHFYRARVMHADVWRQRLDATTNWAVVTTAAVITFGFGDSNSPHFVILLALVFDMFFLFMESRRYQIYHLWQRRVRAMDRYMIAPALREDDEAALATNRRKLSRMAADLGWSIPQISLAAAIGYRIRRNYGALIAVVILVWLLKLVVHPTTATSWSELVERAHIGIVPGEYTMALVALYVVAFGVLALRAPTEQQREWEDVPSPIDRIMPDGLKRLYEDEEGR